MITNYLVWDHEDRKLYELELCMSPSFYIVNCKPGEDPRPRPKKL